MYSIKEIFPKALAQYCDNKILSYKKKAQFYLYFTRVSQNFFGILLEKMLESHQILIMVKK